MYNQNGQLIELFIASTGIFLQTLFIPNPFELKSAKQLFNISSNIAVYYIILTGGVIVTANIFLNPLLDLIRIFVKNSTLTSLLYIVAFNVVYFLTTLVYPLIVKRKDEEDFLTRLLTNGQRRNNPFSFENQLGKDKADYVLRYVIKPSLTAIINLVVCMGIGLSTTIIHALL